MTTRGSNTRNVSSTKKGLRARIQERLHKNPGLEMWSSDLAKELGVEERDIQQSVSGLLRDVPDYPLEVCVRGRSWRYLPNGEKASAEVPKQLKGKDYRPKRIFEELATTKAGELLIQDEAGTVYIAKEL